MSNISSSPTVRSRPRRRRIPGVPNAELASQTAGDVDIPPEPTEEDRALFDEQQVYRTELLMIQGIFHPRELMPRLGVTDPRKMTRYIKRVLSRWMMEGRSRCLSTERGKAIAEFDWVTRKLCSLLEQATTIREKSAILEALIRLREKKNAIMGLTIERAAALNNTPLIGEDELRGIVRQEELMQMMVQFAHLVDEEMEMPE